MAEWLSHKSLKLDKVVGSNPTRTTKTNYMVMDYFGKISENDFYELRKILGTGTWDAGCGLYSYKGYVRLQGNSLRTDVISSNTQHKNPIAFYSKSEKEIEEHKKSIYSKNYKFFDKELSLDEWLELYNKHKNNKFS